MKRKKRVITPEQKVINLRELPENGCNITQSSEQYGINSNLIAFLRMHLFTKVPLQKWLDKPFHPPDYYDEVKHQPSLFNF